MLLFNGGTVCDDNFSYNSAAAICRHLGFSDIYLWTSGEEWSIRSNYNISVVNVQCSGEDWSSCNYDRSHNCDHDEDVFLICGQGK